MLSFRKYDTVSRFTTVTEVQLRSSLSMQRPFIDVWLRLTGAIQRATHASGVGCRGRWGNNYVHRVLDVLHLQGRGGVVRSLLHLVCRCIGVTTKSTKGRMTTKPSHHHSHPAASTTATNTAEIAITATHTITYY